MTLSIRERCRAMIARCQRRHRDAIRSPAASTLAKERPTRLRRNERRLRRHGVLPVDPDQHGPAPDASDWTPQQAVSAALVRQPDEVSAMERRRQLRELGGPPVPEHGRRLDPQRATTHRERTGRRGDEPTATIHAPHEPGTLALKGHGVPVLPRALCADRRCPQWPDHERSGRHVGRVDTRYDQTCESCGQLVSAATAINNSMPISRSRTSSVTASTAKYRTPATVAATNSAVGHQLSTPASSATKPTASRIPTAPTSGSLGSPRTVPGPRSLSAGRWLENGCRSSAGLVVRAQIDGVSGCCE